MLRLFNLAAPPTCEALDQHKRLCTLAARDARHTARGRSIGIAVVMLGLAAGLYLLMDQSPAGHEVLDLGVAVLGLSSILGLLWLMLYLYLAAPHTVQVDLLEHVCDPLTPVEYDHLLPRLMPNPALRRYVQQVVCQGRPLVQGEAWVMEDHLHSLTDPSWKTACRT